MIKTILSLFALCLAPFMAQAQTRYVGGDVSLLPTYEEHGVRYLDQAGNTVEPLPHWKHQAQWNAMRVRLFHDPSKASAQHQGWGARQDLAYATALCRRIKAEGYALMLDIHYSDTWTDPAQHSTPAAWTSTDSAVLADSVYQYTARVLRHLKAEGAAPDMIQVGNEVNVGMMWPTGKCYADGQSVVTDGVTGTFQNFLSYLQSGVKACREVCPEAKIVVHTALDGSGWATTNMMKSIGQQLDYDVIGLSYYPDYHGTLATLRATLNSLERDYSDKEIMIVETGYGGQWSLSGDYTSSVTSVWPASEAGQQKFTQDLIAELLKHNKVTGLFWWLPEDNEYWADSNPARSSWWNASLYVQNTGRPLAALYELQRFLGLDPTAIQTPSVAAPSAAIYNLHGHRLTAIGQQSGLYIVDGRKVAVVK